MLLLVLGGGGGKRGGWQGKRESKDAKIYSATPMLFALQIFRKQAYVSKLLFVKTGNHEKGAVGAGGGEGGANVLARSGYADCSPCLCFCMGYVCGF